MSTLGEEAPVPVTLTPTSELVAQAWLATLPGITTAMVSTVLPTNVAGWAATGFYTVTIAGGVADLELPIRRPLIQVDVYAANVDKQRPPWGRCDQYASIVTRGCFGTLSRPQTVTCVAGTNTIPATVMGAWAAQEPMRVYNDEASVARLRMDLRLDWRP